MPRLERLRGQERTFEVSSSDAEYTQGRVNSEYRSIQGQKYPLFLSCYLSVLSRAQVGRNNSMTAAAQSQ